MIVRSMEKRVMSDTSIETNAYGELVRTDCNICPKCHHAEWRTTEEGGEAEEIENHGVRPIYRNSEIVMEDEIYMSLCFSRNMTDDQRRAIIEYLTNDINEYVNSNP